MSGPETTKRRRNQRSPSPQYRIDGDDNYEPYIPVAQRRQAKLAKLSALGSSTSRDNAREAREAEEEQEDEEKEEERRREKVRKGRALLVEAQEVHSKKASEGACYGIMLDRDTQRKLADAKKTEAEKAEEADAQILAAIASRKKLASDRELAKGIEYTETLRTSWVPFATTCGHGMLSLFCRWVPPRYIRARDEETNQKVREKYHIIVDGQDIPPPIDSFEV
jgi:ATP-dependent RNA helicase DDX41